MLKFLLPIVLIYLATTVLQIFSGICKMSITTLPRHIEDLYQSDAVVAREGGCPY